MRSDHKKVKPQQTGDKNQYRISLECEHVAINAKLTFDAALVQR